MEKFSFGMLKPDCLNRGLEQEAIRRITANGCKMLLSKRTRLSHEDVYVLYGNVADKPFFDEMKLFLMSSDVIVYLVGSDSEVGTIKLLNRITGFTDPHNAKIGTLRELGKSIRENIAHSVSDFSELVKSATHFFNDDDLKKSKFFENLKQ